ncbi:hypothetical protein [Niveispirillum fermenti]|uniref:hypothetical protein n=1 Tax=Niveispirillum fermenti TaxID=1233113 RepID=UPI003A861142
MDLSLGWYAYPWNLHDPAGDLARMRDAGMTHLTVATSYHAGKFIQPRDPVARVYFPEDGAIYFRSRGRVRHGALKPQMAAVTGVRDVLGELCAAGTMPVRAWTVLNHNTRLGMAHPDCTVRNAWGDAYVYSLCPAHPLVRDHAVALCTDIADSLDVESLLLETPGWLTYAHGYHHEFAQSGLPAEIEELLGLCFCDHCRAGATAAGIDADTLRLQARAAIDAGLAGATAAVDADLLAAFHAWRCGIVTALCAEIRLAVRAAVAVRVISTCQRPHATTYREGGDLRALNRVTDGLELPIYQGSAAQAAADLRHVLDLLAGQAPVPGVILRPGLPDMGSEAQLTDTLASVRAQGVNDISFYNFGLLPAPQIGWVDRAVRALRGGGANG